MSRTTKRMADYLRNQNKDKQKDMLPKKKKKNANTELSRIQALFSFRITADVISVMMKQNPDSNDKKTIESWKKLFQLKDDGLSHCFQLSVVSNHDAFFLMTAWAGYCSSIKSLHNRFGSGSSSYCSFKFFMDSLYCVTNDGSQVVHPDDHARQCINSVINDCWFL